MLRITRETDYGIVLMCALAQASEPSVSAALLARRCRLPVPMASKILKILAQAGLLVSQRGPHGGYALAREATDITLAEIVEALEGPIAITECSTEQPDACAYSDHCTINSHWSRINAVIRDALNAISLMDMSAWPGSPEPAPAVTVTFHPLASLLRSPASVQPTSTRIDP